jgi:hypothetical protein
MGLPDWIAKLRERLPGTSNPLEDERLLQLYWNRAELKKEFLSLQSERYDLLEKIKKHEATSHRSKEQQEQLEEHLGDPETGPPALAYFQLRALWKLCAQKQARFAQDLRRQQEDRERRRLLLEFDQSQHARIAAVDRKLLDAQSAADTLETQMQLVRRKMASLKGFWHYFRRRKLQEEIDALHARWEAAATEVTDLKDERAAVEATEPPPFPGMSVEGKRLVNTAAIAYARYLLDSLLPNGVALFAKETTVKRVYDVRYGSREDCVRLMSQVRTALHVMEGDDDSAAIKSTTERIRAAAVYRNDVDTVPLADSIGVAAVPARFANDVDSLGRSGINVLIDDYWDVCGTVAQ